MEVENTAETLKEAGNKEFKAHNYDKALEKYTMAIEYDPNEPSYYANRAACYLAMKRYNHCVQDCNRTLNLNPDFVKALRRRAQSYMMMGKINLAIGDYRAAVEKENDKKLVAELHECLKVEQNYKEAKELMNEQRVTEAITYINQILKIVPDWTDVKILQIECLAKMGCAEKSNEVLVQMSSELSNSPDIYFLRGIIYLYNDNIDRAKKMFTEGLRFDPDDEKCHNALKNVKKLEHLKEKGNEAIKRGDAQAAVSSYNEALKCDPLNKTINSILYSNRALAFMKMNKNEEALLDCNKSLELNEKYVKSYLRRAEIKMKMGEFDGALTDYYKIKELDPTQNVNNLINNAQMEAQKAKHKDYYKILGIEKTATEDEIRKAYRKLALKWHPDKNNENEEKKNIAVKRFKEIAEAYSILSDKTKRQRFDSGMDVDDNGGGFGGAGGGIDPTQIFQMFFGGGGMGGRGFDFGSGGGGGDEDFFSQGGGGGGGAFPFGGAQQGFGGDRKSVV